MAGRFRPRRRGLVALSAAAGLLVVGWLLERAGTPRGVGWLAATVAAATFGVHPIHTEAVDSVFNRSANLAVAFSISSLFIMNRACGAVTVRVRMGQGTRPSSTSKT